MHVVGYYPECQFPVLHPNLAKAKALLTSKETREIFEKYYSGKLDKEKGKIELLKLLDK